MKKIRLQDYEIKAICEAYSLYFADHSEGVYLFGSRVDLNKKGGDIDLYISCKKLTPEQAVQAELTFKNYLYEKIGDQRIDVVLDLGTTHLPIYEIAQKEGVKLA